ncbi:hypothetical protein BBO99_00000634 [Phytophthora kernoviae]|uniref:Uncharacterized protein n=1 Tax=Phytophthora kernoviae TaxID=325452 RepID=A0A3R7K031_9STRA|nr:hypothetical protein BBI17_001451 [Phytophthora kernoviae]RLN85340.1 hypothetical protein BBO99_00000634 [Phytophthora kernoviae]
MIDDCCFSESANVQSLINKFELMAQANAASNASRTRAESSTTAPQKPVDNQISRARTQSEPVQKLEKTPESVVKHNTLTVKTLESDDEDNIKTLNPYEDESDVGSTMCYVNCYSAMPRIRATFLRIDARFAANDDRIPTHALVGFGASFQRGASINAVKKRPNHSCIGPTTTMTTSTTTTLAEPLMSTNYSLRASYYCLNATGEVPETTATNPTHPKAQKPSKTTEKASEVQVTGNAVQVPRLKLSELNWKNRSRFLEMMECHSFVVLTDLGESLERVHDQVLQDFDTFFTSDDDDWKNECISKQIYRNENKTPMWYCGYEHTSVRDCFRVACGDMSRLVWPSPEFKDHWLSLQRRMEKICDRALSLTVGYEIAPSHARSDENFSVCYGLHYPNIQGSGQSETENVFEHVDPSLYVVEPVPSVEGLDVYDPHSKQWLKAEKVCVPGKEIVLFCGKALARATEGRIPGTLHRVRRTPDRRFCIIYEQKYEEYFL